RHCCRRMWGENGGVYGVTVGEPSRCWVRSLRNQRLHRRMLAADDCAVGSALKKCASVREWPVQPGSHLGGAHVLHAAAPPVSRVTLDLRVGIETDRSFGALRLCLAEAALFDRHLVLKRIDGGPVAGRRASIVGTYPPSNLRSATGSVSSATASRVSASSLLSQVSSGRPISMFIDGPMYMYGITID